MVPSIGNESGEGSPKREEFGYTSWFTFLQEGMHDAMFRVTVSATADANTLGDWINFVARTADPMEKCLAGLDDL